jgi:signal transduction histidine kinase
MLYEPPAVFPLSAGVGLAALVLGGFELAPALFLAALSSYLVHGPSFLIGFSIAIGNTLQALVGAYVLRLAKFDPLLRRMRDIFAIGAVALTVSTIVPTVVLLAYGVNASLGGRPAPISWPTYWVGHMWTLLIVTPLIVRWVAKPFYSRNWQQILETVAAFSLLLVLDYAVFWTKVPSVGGVSFVYFMLIPFFWFALRFSPRFVTLALTVTSIIAFAGITWGPAAALSTLSTGTRLYQIQVFLIVIAIIFYILESLATERRYAVESLRVQVRQLENALRRISSEDVAKTEFLSVLAHELRNPLAPIVSGLEMLKLPEIAAAEETRIVEMMTGRVEVIRRLLEDLLDVSRISHRKLTLKVETVDLRALLERSVASVNEFEVQKSHACTLTLPEGPVMIQGDPVRLEQIFINILKNAVKYTPAHGKIDVVLQKNGQAATVRIRDNGNGIERDMFERIFEPFVQAKGAKGNEGGTGLGIGLWLTKQLVQMHEGSIEVKSDGAGKGSEFIIRLPLQETIEPSLFPAKTPAKSLSKKKLSRILVVDDNVPAAEGIGKLLAHRGHATEMAFSGIDAITRAKLFRPDVVLLDIGLPDMSGYEVARTLRAVDDFTGTLVALTGYGQEEDKNRAYDAGFDFHMTKPVSVKDIEEMLTR